MQDNSSYTTHARAVITLGTPLIGSHLAQITIGMSDTIMMGWYGIAELAALVLASSLFFIIFIVGAGFGIAVMPMVSSAIGADDDAQVRRVTRMGFWASAGFAVLSMPLFIWSREVLVALGQEPDTAALAQTYLRIVAFGLAPALFVMVIKSYLSAQECTQVVFVVTVLGAVVNIGLNYLLIFGNYGAPELGIRGAAIASTIVQTLSFPALWAYAAWKFPERQLLARIWRPDTAALAQVFRLGWTIGLTNFAEVGLFTASAVLIGWIGTIELAAHGIALQWASLFFMVHLGLANVATIRAGRALGRRDRVGLRRGGVVVTAIALAAAGAIVLLFLLLPGQMISLFLDSDEPARDQIITLGITLLALAALFQVADGMQAIALGLLRGVQDATVPMILAGISYWGVGMTAGYVLAFPMGYGAAGVWMGLVFGLSVAAILLGWRFWRRDWV